MELRYIFDPSSFERGERRAWRRR